METKNDIPQWWDERRTWIFNQQHLNYEELFTNQGDTPVKHVHGYNRYSANNVNILQAVSFSVHMEALKVAVAVQKEVVVAIETHYFQPLREGVASGLDPETEAPKPTLAEQTRYVRLRALIQVLQELIPIELRLLAWLEGLEDNVKPSLASDIHKALKEVEDVSHRIPDEWGTSGSSSLSSVASQEDVLIDVTTSPYVSLERRINNLHRSIETILIAIRQLLDNVIDKNLDLVSSSPCDITPSVIGSLLIKLPQKYPIED